jgi:ABC-2 type transport system ATP-binding protein
VSEAPSERSFRGEAPSERPFRGEAPSERPTDGEASAPGGGDRAMPRASPGAGGPAMLPAGASPLAIDVTGLTKRFGGRAVVDDVALQVGQGRICGFLGPNGSGKTTTIRMLCGLLTPDAGRGTCLGLDIVTQARRIKRQVGYMTQRFGLYEDLSIRENLSFVARLFELPDRRAAVDTALERLGLVERQRQLAGTLSGGWKQRLALAACLLHRPRLLLLDEPTAGVDPKARRDFWDEIHRLAAQGITVLVSTHYMDEAERCHDLVYIAYGKVLARGTERRILEDAGLAVWSVERAGDGPADDGRLAALVEPLKAAPGVSSVAAFGNALHVAGADADALASAIAPFRAAADLRWSAASPNLEDVFISLIGRAQDNFANGSGAGAPDRRAGAPPAGSGTRGGSAR